MVSRVSKYWSLIFWNKTCWTLGSFLFFKWVKTGPVRFYHWYVKNEYSNITRNHIPNMYMIWRQNLWDSKFLIGNLFYNPTKSLNDFWIITDLLKASVANFLSSLQFGQLNLLLWLRIGPYSFSILSRPFINFSFLIIIQGICNVIFCLAREFAKLFRGIIFLIYLGKIA